MSLLKLKAVWAGYEFRQGTYILVHVFESRDTAFSWQQNARGSRKIKRTSLVTEEEFK